MLVVAVFSILLRTISKTYLVRRAGSDDALVLGSLVRPHGFTASASRSLR